MIIRHELDRHTRHRVIRWQTGLLVLILATATAWPIGCTPPEPEVTPPRQTPVSVSDDDLRHEVDEVLDFTLQRRRLNSQEHGAWQILHGTLAYQQQFPLQIGKDGPPEPAIAYLINGGQIAGWTFQPGDVLDPATGQRGLRAIVEAGTKKGQGHPDQWFANLAQAGLPREEVLKVGGQTYTMDHFVQQVQRDVPYNTQREWSWTLVGLLRFLPTDAQWVAGDGQSWNIERLLQGEVEQEINSSACGGTHRLTALATAVKRRREEGKAVDGVWAEADKIVQQHIQLALNYQNQDGSFSSQFFRRPSNSPDMSIVLGSSGHLLEFMMVAMNDRQFELQQPQVRLAVQQLCGLFRDTQNVSLECGALYHATHALVLFRKRAFGPREYHWEPQQIANAR